MDGHELEADPWPSWMGYSLGRWDGDTLIVDSAGDTDMLEAVCERSSEDWPGSLSDTADRANTRCSGDVNLEERLGKLDADHQIVRDVGPRMLADKLAKLVLPSLTECGAVLEFGSVLGGQIFGRRAGANRAPAP